LRVVRAAFRKRRAEKELAPFFQADRKTEERLMTTDYRYFLTYSGVRLPLKLMQPLEPNELDNRNTYFRASYDPEGRITAIEKLVYGEVELAHVYAYRNDGTLAHARVTIGDEETEVAFDESGAPIRG
jgi:Family of unknown function (DUF6156)